MKSTVKIGLPLLAGAVLASMLITPAPPASASTYGVPVSGTIYGSFDYSFEGKGAWVGYAVLKFGDREPVMASIVDRNTSYQEGKNGVARGTEVVTFTLLDGSGTFEANASFMGIPGATPSLYNLSETASLENGTGRFAGISGQIATHGPYLYPNPAKTPGAPPWIGETHGVVFGLE